MYAFDTHKVVKELTQAGAQPLLAEAMVSTLGTMVENLPTRQDLQTELAALRKDFDASKREIDAKLGFFQEGNDVKFDYIRKDIAALREELDTKLFALREELDTKLVSLREELKADNAALREELKAGLALFDAKARNREIRMIITLGLIVFAAVGLLIPFLS